MMTEKKQHTTLPHISQTAAAPVTSSGTSISVVVSPTQVLPTNDQTPSVLAGAVFGGAAILLVMIVSTLVVVLILNINRTRNKAKYSVKSWTGVSYHMCNNMCVVYHNAYNDCSLFKSCVGVYHNTPGFDSHMQTANENLYMYSG